MLLDTVSTTQSFSDLDASEESYSPSLSSAVRSYRSAAAAHRLLVTASGISEGDEVVFARLDVAEALGIWRHARGRVVETHVEAQATISLDVKFEGHETLHRYLPDLFEKRAQ